MFCYDTTTTFLMKYMYGFSILQFFHNFSDKINKSEVGRRLTSLEKDNTELHQVYEKLQKKYENLKEKYIR